MSDTTDNLALWDAVCTTDPAHTKRVDQRGGYTAICAQSQVRMATEQWGPQGAAWGLRGLVWEYVRDGKGEIVELALSAVLYYPGGEIEIGGDTRYRPGDDGRKKLRTDVLTKALSQLGFNADVFLGQFDDNRYVAAQRRAHEEPPRRDAAPPSRRNDPAPPRDGGSGQQTSEGNDPHPDWPVPPCPHCNGNARRRPQAAGRQPTFECASGCTEEYQGRDYPQKFWRASDKALRASKAAMSEYVSRHGSTYDDAKAMLVSVLGVPDTSKAWAGEHVSRVLDALANDAEDGDALRRGDAPPDNACGDNPGADDIPF